MPVIVNCILSSIAWFGCGAFTVMSVVDFAEGEKEDGVCNVVHAVFWFIVGVAWIAAIASRCSS